MSVSHELDPGGEYIPPASIEFISPEARDWHLKENYGHLTPETIVLSGLDKQHQARIAQLKMIAAHSPETYDHDAYRDWLGIYSQAIGQTDGI